MKTKVTLLILFLTICYTPQAQILKKVKKVAGKVTNTISLDKLSRDPVTTSFKDVDKTKYLENDFGNNAVYKNIHDQPYDWEKGFFLTPGFYEGYFKSFCIKAGTYTPHSGSGRFYAELKGPKADIFEAIIEEYQKSPDLTQREVQLLFWAIIAKTDFQKMKGPIKLTALKLLTAEQIARLSKGAIDSYVSSEIKKVARKNNAIRYILDAENEIRNKFYEGVSDYAEYEEIAMRAGIEPIVKGFEAGRWTKHPDGFFIRYRPIAYSQTVTQIYVPDDIEAFRPIRGKGPHNLEHYPFALGKHYKSRNSIATPADPSAQRLIQTDIEPGTTGGPGGSGGNNDTTVTNPGGNEDPGTTGTGNTGGTGNDGTNTGGNPNGTGTGGQGNTGGSGTGTGGSSSSGTLPGGNNETNAFLCEEVINATADKSIRFEMLNQNIPGALVCVFKGDSIIHMKAYGKMRLNHPLTLNTSLQWASLSKSVTAVAAMQMIEDGRLNLDDKASDVVSNWPQERGKIVAENGNKYFEDRYKNISLRHLLNNTSGIQHYGKGRDNATTTQYGNITFKFVRSGDYSPAINGGWNANSSVEQFNKSILDFPPGSNYLYSSYGFNLAGAMIDAKINYGYDDWVIKYIKNHLGLKSFGMARHVSNRYGYEYENDGILKNVALIDHDDVLPAGGWQSTICDLATYGRALSQGELLKEKDVLWRKSNMYIQDTLKTGGYGLGLNRYGVGDDIRVFHGGTNTGSRAFLFFFPKDSTGIAILAPFRQAGLERMARNLVQDMSIRPGLYNSEKKPLDKCHRGMKSGKDMFIGVWRKTGDEQIIRTGLELAEFRDEIIIMRNYGYHLDDFEIHITNDYKQIYDGVFKKGVKSQVLITGKNGAEMANVVNRFRAQNLEIVDVEYGRFDPSSDDMMFNSSLNALFENGALRSTLVSDRTQNEFQTLVEDYQASDLKLIDVEGHPFHEQTVFTGLFIKGTGNKLLIKPPTEFMEDIQAGRYVSYGKLLDVDMFLRGDNPRARFVISIWEPSSNAMRSSYSPAKQPVLNFCSFMDMHEKNRDDGYELIDFDRIYTHVE